MVTGNQERVKTPRENQRDLADQAREEARKPKPEPDQEKAKNG